MATTLYEAIDGINDISSIINQSSDRVDSSRQNLVDASTELANIATTYATLSTDIDAALLADPTNEGWIDIKAKKDTLLVERATLKTRADALIVAWDAV